jgi:hypothetical protein
MKKSISIYKLKKIEKKEAEILYKQREIRNIIILVLKKDKN